MCIVDIITVSLSWALWRIKRLDISKYLPRVDLSHAIYYFKYVAYLWMPDFVPQWEAKRMPFWDEEHNKPLEFTTVIYLLPRAFSSLCALTTTGHEFIGWYAGRKFNLKVVTSNLNWIWRHKTDGPTCRQTCRWINMANAQVRPTSQPDRTVSGRW